MLRDGASDAFIRKITELGEEELAEVRREIQEIQM